ncbi:MAG: thiamine-binding protein [Bacillota bacterium]|nr:thiamine-binding protein [Bacillota bacterium]
MEGPKSRLHAAVDRAIAVVAASGVKYEVGPFETTMEGDLKELLEIVYRAQAACPRRAFWGQPACSPCFWPGKGRSG